MEEDDYVNYTCPVGYIYDATHDISVSAVCKNGTWLYDFDPTKMCVRKYLFHYTYKNSFLITQYKFLNFSCIL